MIASGLTSSADAVLWSLVLIGGIAFLGVLVFFIRRKLFSDRQQSPEAVLSLQQLRDMLAAGQINEAEFARLKAALLGIPESPAPRKDRPDASAPHGKARQHETGQDPT